MLQPADAKIPAVYVFTPQGAAPAKRLERRMPVRIYAASSLKNVDAFEDSQTTRPVVFFDSLSALMGDTFSAHPCHLFISAAAIAIRAVAPFIRDKLSDPSVLAMDHRGRFIVSLLSGHVGGANAMAAKIAGLLGATPVITTATDTEQLPALDEIARRKGLSFANPGAVKHVSAALLAGKNVALHDPGNLLGLRNGPWQALFHDLSHKAVEDCIERAAFSGPAVLVTEKSVRVADEQSRLIAHPRVLHVGIGCRRGTAAGEILRQLHDVFARNGLSLQSLAFLASLDAKADEAGLLEASARLGLELRLFSAAELAAFPVSQASRKAWETFGLAGVCEPAALASAALHEESTAKLMVAKQTGNGVTIAVAQPGYKETLVYSV